MDEAPKKRPGRPPRPPGAPTLTTLVRRLRMLPGRWAKFDRLGGRAWLERVVDQAAEPGDEGKKA